MSHSEYIDSILKEQSIDTNNESTIEKIKEMMRVIEVSEMQFKTIGNQFNDALVKKYKTQKKVLANMVNTYVNEQSQKGLSKEKILGELKKLFLTSNMRCEEYLGTQNKSDKRTVNS